MPASPEMKSRFWKSVSHKENMEAAMFASARSLADCSKSKCNRVPFDVSWLLDQKPSKSMSDAQRLTRFKKLRAGVESLQYESAKEMSKCSSDHCEKEIQAFFESRKRYLLSELDSSVALIQMIMDSKKKEAETKKKEAKAADKKPSKKKK